MSLHSKYTEDQKSTALAYYVACGSNLTKAAKDCNIPKQTLHRWLNGGAVNEAVSRKRDTKKLDLADLFEKELRAALNEADGKREDASYGSLMTAAAIAADKMRLLREQTTDNQKLHIHVQYVDADPRKFASGADAD